MPETFYTALYCGMGRVVDPATGLPAIAPVTVQMNFEHFARSFVNSAQCGGPDGRPTGLQADMQIVERHGSFGFVAVQIDTGYQTKWQQAHPQGKSALNRVEMANAPTLEDARTQAAALRAQIKTFLDKANIPNAPSERERAINYLQSLGLTGIHPGFKVVRDCYVEALQDVAGTQIHHWIWRAPFHKEIEPPGWPVDATVVTAMLSQLDTAGPTSQRRTMQYAFMYGGLSMVLDSPVT